MANKTIAMYKIRQLIRLSLEGKGSKYISATVGISRNTVKKYLALLRGSGYDGQQLADLSDDKLMSLLCVQRVEWTPSPRHKELQPLLADYKYMNLLFNSSFIELKNLDFQLPREIKKSGWANRYIMFHGLNSWIICSTPVIFPSSFTPSRPALQNLASIVWKMELLKRV